MRIGINGRFLLTKKTGVQRAAYNLVKALFEMDNENQYFLFTSKDQINNKEWAKPNVTVVGSDIRYGENFKNHFWEQIVLPRLAKQYDIDILHSIANIAPLFYKGDSIVHIHDLCFVVNPQWYSYSFRTLYNWIVPRLARKATKVVTNSNNSKNDLLQFCRINADKVELIYWAVDQTFEKTPETEIEAPVEGEYILYVGSLEPRKNISMLIRSYETMRNNNPSLSPKLVLIGGDNPLFADVKLQIKRYSEDIVFKGYVSDSLLKSYYKHALVVAYPSLYEGFGLPPLEAMASGAPVMTSNTSSLPEVVGNAALLVNPNDQEQIARVLERVVKDVDLRRDMRARGAEQVKKFNWARVARNIVGIYYETYNKKNGKTDGSFLSFDKWQSILDHEKKWL